jgi:hypothetical protein
VDSLARNHDRSTLLAGPDGKLGEVTHLGSIGRGTPRKVGVCHFLQANLPHTVSDRIATVTDLRTGAKLSKTFPSHAEACPREFTRYKIAGQWDDGTVEDTGDTRAAEAWFKSLLH